MFHHLKYLGTGKAVEHLCIMLPNRLVAGALFVLPIQVKSKSRFYHRELLPKPALSSSRSTFCD